MIILHSYSEFGEGMGFPSMMMHFEKERYSGQDVIVSYLKNNGNVHMVNTGIPKDVFTGEMLDNLEYTFKDDGNYSWISTLPYYVDRYNLRLPKEFEDYVFNKMKKKKSA